MAGHTRWLFTRDQLSNTPSIKNGFTEEKESTIRQQAADLIQKMGQKMQLNQLCMNTAIVYMHRFYMFHSLQKFPFKRMAAACIFLAAKVEEQPKKIELVIRTYNYINHRTEDGGRPPELDVRSQEYFEKGQELVINENILLQTLGFNVTIDHSNTHVVKLCQLVKAPKELSQLSYFLSTNSLLLTNMCLQYPSEIIAAICIHLACKWSDWELQRSKEGRDWWQYLAPKLTKDKLEDLSKRFLSVMEKADPKLKRELLSRLTLPTESSPNSRGASPAPHHGSRPSSSHHRNPQSHPVPHIAQHSHPSHSKFTPDRGHLAKPASSTPPPRTYSEYKERARSTAAAAAESKVRPYDNSSRPDLKRPYPKDTHLSGHPSSSTSKSHSMVSPHQSAVTSSSHNPYNKQPRNHENMKSRYHQRQSMDGSPLKKPKTGGENGSNGERPPLPPQPPLPRPPLPP